MALVACPDVRVLQMALDALDPRLGLGRELEVLDHLGVATLMADEALLIVRLEGGKLRLRQRNLRDHADPGLTLRARWALRTNPDVVSTSPQGYAHRQRCDRRSLRDPFA